MTEAELDSVVHVGDWKFGNNVRIEEHIDDITKVPKRFVSTDVQILLRERYEQAHGIYDHKAAGNDHFALVRHHWCEDAIGASRLRERMESFIEARVGHPSHFNMSFTEFINQPPYVCDLMLEVLQTRAPAQEQELQDALDEFKNKNRQR